MLLRSRTSDYPTDELGLVALSPSVLRVCLVSYFPYFSYVVVKPFLWNPGQLEYKCKKEYKSGQADKRL